MSGFFHEYTPTVRSARKMVLPAMSLWLAAVFAPTLAATTLTAAAHAQPKSADGADHKPVENPPSFEALVRALDRRMTVWRTRHSASVSYVKHCRDSDVGCSRRVFSLARLIDEASARYRLDPFLLAAVAVRESGLNPFAAGSIGERGLVQLHPRGAGARVRFVQSERYRRRCARRPDACQAEVLDAGAHLLARCLRRCRRVKDALGAYNRGKCGETNYARMVMRERQRLLTLAKTDIRSAPALRGTAAETAGASNRKRSGRSPSRGLAAKPSR